jgi:hypothetical protein
VTTSTLVSLFERDCSCAAKSNRAGQGRIGRYPSSSSLCTSTGTSTL